MLENKFQKLCKKKTGHRWRKWMGSTEGRTPENHYYKCRLCGKWFWNYDDPSGKDDIPNGVLSELPLTIIKELDYYILTSDEFADFWGYGATLDDAYKMLVAQFKRTMGDIDTEIITPENTAPEDYERLLEIYLLLKESKKEEEKDA